MIQQEDILYGKISIAGPPIIVGSDPYTGSYEVTPKVSQQILPTENKSMTQNLTVKAIGYYAVSNPSGITVTIGDM